MGRRTCSLCIRQTSESFAKKGGPLKVRQIWTPWVWTAGATSFQWSRRRGGPRKRQRKRVACCTEERKPFKLRSKCVRSARKAKALENAWDCVYVFWNGIIERNVFKLVQNAPTLHEKWRRLKVLEIASETLNSKYVKVLRKLRSASNSSLSSLLLFPFRRRTVVVRPSLTADSLWIQKSNHKPKLFFFSM